MKVILTPLQMKIIDEYAIRKLHIPSHRLMENAGKAVVAELVRRVENISEKSILIFCGKGNNGGDGLVVARLLLQLGASVKIILLESKNSFSSDAKEIFEHFYSNTKYQKNIVSFKGFVKSRNKKADIIIDAMLGISFKGKLRGNYIKAVQFCNRHNALNVAVDIPTGLDGTTGEVMTEAFRARVTVTFSNPKIGFYCSNAKAYTGEVIVADIKIPSNITKAIPSDPQSIFLYEQSDVQKQFPRRASNSHKHSVGKVFCVAGSQGMTGAALLCSQSVMRSGAGQVILGIPDSEYSHIAKRTIEVMPLGLPSTKKGSISIDAKQKIMERINWANVILLGCGMSQHPKTKRLIREIIENCSKPIVIDADGLNALSDNLNVLKKSKSKSIVLTPHLGEFSRLTGLPSKEIETKKFILASQFAKKNKVTLVLKGAPTIVADSKGRVFVNPTGNPGMSTAGSGDVLAGIIASFIGQGNSGIEASKNGVFVHGLAGDIGAKEVGQLSLLATDIIKFLPAAFKRIMVQ